MLLARLRFEYEFGLLHLDWEFDWEFGLSARERESELERRESGQISVV